MSFPGFLEDNPSQISIPEQFFQQVLLEIKDRHELTLMLYIFWRLDRMEGPFHYLRYRDLLEDSQLLRAFGNDPLHARDVLDKALRKAVNRGTLLQAVIDQEKGKDSLICLNSPKGQAAVEAIKRGEWRMSDDSHPPIELYTERPNIFQLYEANIGPLTPLIADALRDAEKTYQVNWIEDAFRIAVERNRRSWKYIEAILRHWQEGGRDDRKEQQDRRDTEEARRRYGEWEK
jgi:DnaD/phage-associated family protein